MLIKIVLFLLLQSIVGINANCHWYKMGPFTTCTDITTVDLFVADCSYLGLRKMPKSLPINNTESDYLSLDLSHNKISTISASDLKAFVNLERLNLSHNRIASFGHDIPLHFPRLDTIDLGCNRLVFVAEDLFIRPSKLKWLSVKGNSKLNLEKVLFFVRMVTAPLAVLDISFNRLDYIPNLRVMPNLVELNVVGNKLFDPSPEPLAGACHLKILHTDTLTFSTSNCNCDRLLSYLTESKITQQTLYPLTSCYGMHPEDCAEFNFSLRGNAAEANRKCLEIHNQRAHKMWEFIASGIFCVILLLVFVVLVFVTSKSYCMFCCSKDHHVAEGEAVEAQNETNESLMDNSPAVSA